MFFKKCKEKKGYVTVSSCDPDVTSTSPSCIKTGKMAADTQVCVAGF